jgi:hypothetical protein
MYQGRPLTLVKSGWTTWDEKEARTSVKRDTSASHCLLHMASGPVLGDRR